MKLILIIIIIISVFYFIDTYLKKVLYIFLFACVIYMIYKFLKWVNFKIECRKLSNDLYRINSNLDNIENEIDNLISNSITYSNIESFDKMDGHQFEYFCADVLKKNKFENVEVTQGSGDHGVDILAEKDGVTYAIQCKCYSSDIGNSAVQQAHTGKSIYKKDIAVVLTNRYFTAQAKEEAAALGVKLWDRDKLNNLVSRCKGNVISDNYVSKNIKDDMEKRSDFDLESFAAQCNAYLEREDEMNQYK